MILKKQAVLKLPHLTLVLGDGADLTDYFAEAEISGLFLNFSDPWHKTRHEKRRLTYRRFLTTYTTNLKPDARLTFKTEHTGLFEYSLVSMKHFGMTFELVSLDVLLDTRIPDNVPTEYEEKYCADGGRIYELVARFKA